MISTIKYKLQNTARKKINTSCEGYCYNLQKVNQLELLREQVNYPS